MGNFTPLKIVNRKPKIFRIIIFIILFFVFMAASTYFLYAKKMLFFKIKCVPGQLICQRDNPLICLSNNNGDAGILCDSSGNKYDESNCKSYTGCNGFVYSKSTCTGTGFQGCNVHSRQENCFCVNGKFSCVSDVGGTSCGLNSPGGIPTPPPAPIDMPTPAPPTSILEPTVIPTLILEPATSTPTPTIGPT